MPGAGFSSPTILFLSTWDAPERSFCKQVLTALLERGYTRYIEPCAGAFAMPLIAAAAGWTPDRMEASDVSLFTAIVGTMLAEGDLNELGVRVDGEQAQLPDVDITGQAAHLLWLQLLTRMQAKPEVPYWQAIVTDLTDGADQHRAAIRRKLIGLSARLSGLQYTPMDAWTHIERVADDPHTVISINAPTYKAGFEKFFDTKGRLTWDEPDYAVWDPDVDTPKLNEVLEGRAALLLSQQQKEPGHAAHPMPVFARHLSLGQYVYITSNRPDEVFQITGGPKVSPRTPGDLTPSTVRILPPDHEVTADSTVMVVQARTEVVDYYRELWMHRLAARPGPHNLLVIVDGMVAGVIGYSTDAMTNSYPGADKWATSVILRFAFGAPHNTLRLTRLATMLAMSKSTPQQVMTGQTGLYLAASTGLITVEMTRHPEIKGLRGLMKLVDRQKHPDGYKLVYSAEWNDLTPARTLERFLVKEQEWRSKK